MFRHLSLMAIITFFGMVGLFLTGSFLLQHHNANETLAEFLQTHHLSFMFWRYSLIGLLLIIWPRLIRAIGQWKRWDEETITYLIKNRWYLFGFVILFELLIMHNLLGTIVGWLYQMV